MSQAGLNPANLQFIDKLGPNEHDAVAGPRPQRPAAGGQGSPRHWKTTTLIAVLDHRAMRCSMTMLLWLDRLSITTSSPTDNVPPVPVARRPRTPGGSPAHRLGERDVQCCDMYLDTQIGIWTRNLLSVVAYHSRVAGLVNHPTFLKSDGRIHRIRSSTHALCQFAKSDGS